MKKSFRFNPIPIYLIGIFSGLNFLELFKIGIIPIFQIIIAVYLIFYFLLNKNWFSCKDEIFQQYKYFHFASIPAVLMGLIFYNNGFLTFIYTIYPLLLSYVIYREITIKEYFRFLNIVNLSMLAISVLGWLIRLNVLPMDFLFEVIESEFKLGYWGIRYTTSTRNADYLYPLIGLAISGFFYIRFNFKRYLIFISFFLLSLIASYSRGAIVISIVFLIYLFYLSKNKLFLVTMILITIGLFFDFILYNLNETYAQILNSIFKAKNESSKFSNEDRIEIIYKAIESTLLFPLGTGLDNYEIIYTDNSSRKMAHAENVFLTALIERGWIAFGFLIVFFKNLIKSTISFNYFTLNKILVLFLLIYFMLNYELNNAFGNFAIFLVLLDHLINKKKLSID